MWQRQRQKVGSDGKKDEIVNFIKLPSHWSGQHLSPWNCTYLLRDSKAKDPCNEKHDAAEDNEESKKLKSKVVDESEQEYDDYEEEGGEYEEQG
ncbi:hypothetical protein Tco_1100882, partial [Tanacetum coccineum]